MRNSPIAGLVAAVAAVAAAGPARAEAEDGSPRRFTAIYLVMGAGTPIGFVGFEGVHHLSPRFEISVGLGRGFMAMAAQKDPTPTRDVQWAVMPRVRAGEGRHVVTLGAGLSGGNYGSGGEFFCDGPCPDRDYPLSYVVWANLEIGSEHWWGSGFALRTFAGYARGCSSSSCSDPNVGPLSIPYFGFGMGYAF